MARVAHFVSLSILIVFVAVRLRAADVLSNDAELEARIATSASRPPFRRTIVGHTRQGVRIPAIVDATPGERRRVLIVGGLDGLATSTTTALALLADARLQGAAFLSCVPDVCPGASDGTGVTAAFPPPENAYGGLDAPEAAYLWRWIGVAAPDLVVEIRHGDGPRLEIARSAPRRESWSEAGALIIDAERELIGELPRRDVALVGRVPAIRLTATDANEAALWLLAALRVIELEPSPARREIERRRARSPLDVAAELESVYGHELPSVVYIPSVALIARLRLEDLRGSTGTLGDVERIVTPWLADDAVPLPDPPTGSHLSGHLIFAELATRSVDHPWLELARRAADLGFDTDGTARESMPAHSEMSDAIFMGGPILAMVGALTGEPRYFDQCLRHIRFVSAFTLRPDGLHRHSPLDDTAWGRGNGFPALGIAWSLEHIPGTHPARAALLASLRDHLRALLAHQDLDGTWRQVIDEPGSYRELSATSMITFAMLRGMRRGWISRDEFERSADLAWDAIRDRVGTGGALVDVCTGTGKQRSLRDYLDRRAILGPDDRGGAMAMLVAVERAFWEEERGTEKRSRP